MTTYNIKWEGKPVTVNIHSEMDFIVQSCFESLLERCLGFNNSLDMIAEDPYSLSQYNKGQYMFLVKKEGDGFVVNYCCLEDYEAGRLPSDLIPIFREKMGYKPLMVNASTPFLASERKMPWMES